MTLAARTAEVIWLIGNSFSWTMDELLIADAALHPCAGWEWEKERRENVVARCAGKRFVVGCWRGETVGVLAGTNVRVVF